MRVLQSNENAKYLKYLNIAKVCSLRDKAKKTKHLSII